MEFNAANLHLVLNHWPVLLPVVAFCCLLVGLFARLRQVQNVGLVLQIFAGIFSWLAYLSGGPARDIIQNYPEVTASSIEAHQTMAFYSSLGLSIVSLLCAIALWQDFKKIKNSITAVLVILFLIAVTCVMMGWTAHEGGLIRHEELLRGSF